MEAAGECQRCGVVGLGLPSPDPSSNSEAGGVDDMERRSIETIVESLNRAGVRYLVAGGLAVVAHGLVRFTADLDLVLDPDPDATRRAIDTLSGLGYRPRAPVGFTDFADPEKRRTWFREKGLTVFSVFSDEHPATEIDLFVETRSTSSAPTGAPHGSRWDPASRRLSSVSPTSSR